jgi:hypothetical protein
MTPGMGPILTQEAKFEQLWFVHIVKINEPRGGTNFDQNAII